MLTRQLDRGAKTVSQAAEVLLEVGLTLAQVNCMLAVYKDVRGVSSAVPDHLDKRYRPMGSGKMPSVAVVSPPFYPKPSVLKKRR